MSDPSVIGPHSMNIPLLIICILSLCLALLALGAETDGPGGTVRASGNDGPDAATPSTPSGLSPLTPVDHSPEFTRTPERLRDGCGIAENEVAG